MTRAARGAAVALCCIALLTLTGCFVMSVNPLYGASDTVYDNGLEGSYTSADGGGSMTFARNSAGTCYLITYEEKGEPNKYDGCLTRIGKLTFLDITPVETQIPEGVKAHLLPLHSFWRMEIAADSFTLQGLDERWLKERLEKKQLVLAHAETGSDGDLLLTGSTASLRDFFRRYGARDAIFGDKDTFQRQK